MRRFLMSTGLILAATLAPLSAGHAQLTFGGLAGVNFSDLDISNLSANEVVESRTGFMLGGWVGKHLGSIFTVQLEGFFTQKGADFTDPSGTVNAKISYIEVPLILKASIPLVVIKPHVYAGPAISFKTSCTVSDPTVSLDCNDPLVDLGVKSTDFSGIVGAGVDLGPFLIAVQYDFSFSSIIDDPTDTIKNQTWTILAGFGI